MLEDWVSFSLSLYLSLVLYCSRLPPEVFQVRAAPNTADVKGEGVLCLASIPSRSKTLVVLPFSTHARNKATT